MKKNLLFIAILLLAASVYGQPNTSAPQKFALVIGNGDYENLSKLRNPVNDANDIAAVLLELGFTVDRVLNGTQEQMADAVIQLKNRLSASKNSYGFLFYAGHGVQHNGENFLIPVDANIPSENFLRNRSVSVQEMLDELNDAGNILNAVVLDACRDNPFGWRRSGSRGLAFINHQPADSIIVYATAAGSTAADGSGRNGLFTTHFLHNLKTPGLEIKEVFNRTGADVIRASSSLQRPAVYSQFYGTAYLGPEPTEAASAPTPALQPAVALLRPAPQRPVPDTFVRIHSGTFSMGSPANEPNRGSDEIQRQVTVSSFFMSKYEVTQKEFQDLMGMNPSHFKGANLPVENISWFDAIEYCIRRSEQEGLTAAYTVSGTGNSRTVSWNREANGYRLPTEAEWEYACRAGTAAPFSTGNNIPSQQANYDSTHPYNNNVKGEFRKTTTPAGTFAANPWGLHDMHGNVREWCWDWYGTYAIGVQNDPDGAASGSRRVERGGSWKDSGQQLRSAFRSYYYPANGSDNLGFRLALNN